jgi:hypothetical protein
MTHDDNQGELARFLRRLQWAALALGAGSSGCWRPC